MRIAIDPGHGMSNSRTGVYDPGATHSENGITYEEAAINLQYGLALKVVFQARGHDVFMTRADAEDNAPVGERARNAENAGCDVFISLHVNDDDDDTANGLEVLYRDSDDEQLAQKLQDVLLEVTGFRDRKIKQRTNLAVLKFDGVAVLIELGFIANDENRNTILNPQKRQAICEKIADVVIEHFG